MADTDVTSSATGGSVVCVGEPLVVLAPHDGGPLATATLLRRSVGGAETNVARMLAALGVPVDLVSRLGTDPWGDAALAALVAAGVGVAAIERDDARPTGFYVKSPGPTGSTMAYHRAGSSATAMGEELFASPVVAATLVGATVVHTSGITAGVVAEPAALLRALGVAREAGALVSVDLNWRAVLWQDRADDLHHLHGLLELADLVFVGADEARAALGTDDPDALRARLRPQATLVLKSDAHDAVAVEPDGSRTRVPALRVDVVEPVGAGDAFAAGYLAGHVRGLPVVECLRLGHRCAAAVLVSQDDHANPPSWAELRAEIAVTDEEWLAAPVCR